MERLVIRGGVPLKGKIRVSGAKNAVLKLMCASLLSNEPCCIRNVPRIKDVETMCDVLRSLGARVDWRGSSLWIEVRDELEYTAPHELIKSMRASIQVMGPLLVRLGKVRVSLPGGCAIGDRPIDMHLRGLRALGARVWEDQGYVYAQGERLEGAEIHLDYPSVGATENLMMAAALARGRTIIQNAAMEPEIVESQEFLNQMGARIRGAGTNQIEIDGVEELGGADYQVIPDRVEAGSYMLAAAMTGGDLIIEGAVADHLGAVIHKLLEAGVELECLDRETIRVRAAGPIRPFHLRTRPYPGFPTDLQPQFVSLATIARGISIITEEIYNNRLKHVAELRRMGADIVVEGQTAIIRGVGRLSGAVVSVPDLRAGAALVLAGLAAEGETVVEDVGHIDRGYEGIEGKLAAVGAQIRREGIEERAC
ncbi:MAG: UDP-N-acetylglucosamine 1-carboxyvinyltransferase [Limnochordia bacterium]|nr:UDP-N-acetylglucosamine 1-carboxyvinyltransferase [Bacillota bacterium]